MVDISTAVGIVPLPPKKISVGNISSGAFQRGAVRVYWHPLGCRAIELENPPEGGAMFTVVYRIASAT